MRTLEQNYTKDVEVKKDASVKEKKTLSYEEQKKLKGLQNKLSKAESKIVELEKKIAKADMELADNYEQLISDTKWFEAYEKLKKDLDVTMEEWEQISEEIENN